MLLESVLESSAIHVFFLGACVVNGWITIRSEPILNIVPLRVQEVQDALDPVFLRENLMVLFLLYYLICIDEIIGGLA